MDATKKKHIRNILREAGMSIESPFQDDMQELIRSLRETKKSNVTFNGQGIPEIKGDKGDTGEKGDPGYTPLKGKDYFTPKEIDLIIEYVTKQAQPIKGRDYVDGRDGKHGEDGKDGKDGRDGLDGRDGHDGKDAVLSDIKKAVAEIVKDPKFQIDKKNVKGLDMSDQRWHGGGLSTVAHDATLTGNGTASSPLSVVSGGSSGYQQPTSGVVDGTNVTFQWAIAPKVIVVDQGRTMQQVSSDTNVNWTGTTTTILQVAPNFDIYAIA